MIGIRVDVNRQVATGHIRRDIAIALQLREMGEECVFISADDTCLPYLEPLGFKRIILNSRWDALEEELVKLEAVIREEGIRSLLVDSYLITEGYMTCLKKLTKVTYFDELYLLGYGCQQLINGVLVPPDYTKAPGKALLGPDYVSLRQDFSELPPKVISPELKTLFITSGGTDNYHFIKLFLEFFLKKRDWKHVKVVAALGELSVDKEELRGLYEGSDRVELHINSPHMVQLLGDADYAVCAGGTTLYEVCAVGVASSCFSIADNQMEIAQSFDDRGLVSYAGDFRKAPQEVMENILWHMEPAKEEAYRRAKAARLQQLVDGKGARRIAQALLDIVEE